MSKLSVLVSCLALLAGVFCDSCKSPELTLKTFTTDDATIVTNIAYIAEFSVKCASGGRPSTLYAELNGNVVPVSVTGANKYQISWTEETKTAKSGDRVVRVFDEDGYTALRKALRSGEDPASVSALFDVVINHPGAYSGPWLKSELFATIISLVVAYFAISFKLKVTA